MRKIFAWLFILLLCPIGFETMVKLLEGVI